MLPNKIIILDTETISLEKPYIYDLGYIIAEKQENGLYAPIEVSQQIIEQIYDNIALFSTAYYENKRLKYTSLMKGKTARKIKYGFALQELARKMAYHEIDTLSAYNSPFDKKALTFTTNFFKVKDVFAEKNWIDIHAVANNFIHQTKEYLEMAVKNKWYGESGLLQTNAERTYAYLTSQTDYVEEHTSLQDCFIELDILNKCIELGFDNTSTYKKTYIKSEQQQTLTIESKGKTYSYKYVKKIVRKDKTIVLL